MDYQATKKAIEAGCALPQQMASALWAAYEAAKADVCARERANAVLSGRVVTMTEEHETTLRLQTDLQKQKRNLEGEIDRRVVIRTSELERENDNLRSANRSINDELRSENHSYEKQLTTAYESIRELRGALSNYLDSGFLRTMRSNRIAKQVVQSLEEDVPNWEDGFPAGDQEEAGHHIARRRRTHRNRNPSSDKQGWVSRWLDRT